MSSNSPVTTRILAFGDSLTWGFDAAAGGRFPAGDVWAGVMGHRLGPDAEVVVEALNGRTTVIDSPYAPSRAGSAMLGPLLETHLPLDLVIIMLGTNDLQVPLHGSAAAAAAGMWTLVDIVLRSGAGPAGGSPQVLVMAPPPIDEPRGFMGVFLAGQEAESRRLAPYYRTIADQAGVAFFDAGTVTAPGAADGIHLDREGNSRLGVAVADVVRSLLSPGPSAV